jgi:hypothetical protein
MMFLCVVSYSVYSWTPWRNFPEYASGTPLCRLLPCPLRFLAPFNTAIFFLSGTIHMCNDSMVFSLLGGHDSMAIHQVPMINATGNYQN